MNKNAPGRTWTDEQVTQAFEMSRYSVIHIRECFVEHGQLTRAIINIDPEQDHEHWREHKKRICLRLRAARLPHWAGAGACDYEQIA
jgi:hypothetical protein